MNLPGGSAGTVPAAAKVAGQVAAPTAPALRTASVGGGARTVVETDGAGTALAIAALVASIISFGIVLFSFLSK